MEKIYNLNESEKNRIKSLHNIKNQKDYVFDLVITENNKYLIFMDHVFLPNSNGESIGTIWENTFIFDELLKESIKKIKGINESIENKINAIFENITWKKEDIVEWIKDVDVITEEEGGFLNKLVSGAKNIGGKIVSSLSSMAMSAFKNGVLPLLRWVRRNAQTNIGIVVDAIIAFFSFKSSAVVWLLIVALDIYEIATGDYDPKDPQRMQMPFFYLISDLLSAVLTAGFGVLFKKAAPTIAKEGIKNPTIKNALIKLIDKIPGAKNSIINVLKTMETKMPTGKSIISKIINSIDNVLSQLINFIRRLFSREGVQAAGSGVVALGASKGVEQLIKASGKGEQLGGAIVKTDKYLQNKAANITGITDIGKLKVSEKSKSSALDFLDNMV
jgi:hypothetical protein